MRCDRDRMTKAERKERRRQRREQVALERDARQQEREAAGLRKKLGRRIFTAKARSGDALTIRFEFSGIPVPVDDPSEPNRGLQEKHDLLVQQMDHARKEPPN